MDLPEEIVAMETYYFGKYLDDDMKGEPYIDSDTWRGFSSKFKTKDLASHSLLCAYEHIILDLESFLDDRTEFTREEFDAQHHRQIESLRIHLNIQSNGDQVAAAANGTFYGSAYNSYAKVVDLANKTWFARVFLSNNKSKYSPHLPKLRHALHVPLDITAHNGLRHLMEKHSLPPADLPKGGMGTVKSQGKYLEMQSLVRSIVDPIKSDRFESETVAPLVIDSYWTKSLQ